MADRPPEPRPEVAALATPPLLASDQRRDQCVAVLSAACVDGRLGLEDFSTRVERALSARTIAELAQLEADLDPAPGPVVPAGPSQPMPAAWFVAIMSSTVRRGRWLLRPVSHALALMGEVTLDLRGAEVTGRQSHISAIAVMGTITVIVPEGIHVELDGLVVMGVKSLQGGSERPLPGSPVVLVTALVLMGEVTVVTKGSKGSRLGGDRGQAGIAWNERKHRKHLREHRRQGGENNLD